MLEDGVGCANFTSIAAQKGEAQSPRDDLVALGHVLIYLLRGNSLPWSAAETEEEEALKKRTTERTQHKRTRKKKGRQKKTKKAEQMI